VIGAQLTLDLPVDVLDLLDVARADRTARAELLANLAVARPAPTCRCDPGPLVLTDGFEDPPCARCGRQPA
jgi:hypothetical protein